MKNLVFILVFLVVAIGANAQRIGTVRTIDVDTLQGAETVNFGIVMLSGEYNAVTFQALCTELGGTADGTLNVMGSVDGTSYVNITDASGLAKGFPNDTLTITDGAILQFVVQDAPFRYYKLVGTGTASDTTLVQWKYVLK